MSKKQESAVGYRPSEEIKKMFEKVCSGPASMSRGQLIEIAMRFLYEQGDEKMKKIVTDHLLGDWGTHHKEDKKKSA